MPFPEERAAVCPPLRLMWEPHFRIGLIVPQVAAFSADDADKNV